ncbi:MAG: murein biosynthesis integral membrane protein MurJ [Deltaproteobacteria bacterium]|nr:murein biosynthesis integral membrane protein MurJ [Deltaproteobacteria bacterium]
MTRKEKLARITFWIMLATLGSRALGFLREVQLAYYFGLSDMRGAFTVAFKIPNLIRTLIADAAISAAFIPVFTESLLKHKEDRAWQIGSRMINMTFLGLSFIVIVCEIFMPQIIRITTPGFSEQAALFEHTVRLSRIMFPIITLLGIGGIVVGIAHSLQQFTAASVAPIFWNIINILAVYFWTQHYGIDAAAWGLLAATGVMLTVQVIPFFKAHFKYSWELGWHDPTLRHIGMLMIPVSLSIGVINFNALVNNYFASQLGAQALAAIDSAFRLFQLPQGLFAIAIGTVLFPTLSQLIIQKEYKRFAKAMDFGIREIFFVTLPFTGFFMILALPISQFCFERGAFGLQDSKMVAVALIYYSIGMAFTSANTLLNRGFYSLKKTWLALNVSFINIGLTIVLNWWLMKPLGHGGICLATSLVSIFTFFGLLYLMKKEVPELEATSIFRSLLKLSLLTFIFSGSLYFIWTILDMACGRSFLGQLISLTLSFGLAGGIYLLLGLLFRLEEMTESVKLLTRRMQKPPVESSQIGLPPGPPSPLGH